jgi:phage shock protein PspC (stress-responsive transcriptional regulator)
LKGKIMESKRLARSSTKKIIGGVCGGLSDFTGIDVSLIRVLWVVLALLFFGSLFIIYFVLWFILPTDNSSKSGLEAVVESAKTKFGNNGGNTTYR